MRAKRIGLLTVAAAALCVASHEAKAAFSLFDNFDTYTTGPLSGQGGWTTSTTAGAHTDVVAATGSDNEAQVYGNSIPNYKPLGALTIPNASTAATVYFNFKMAASTTGNNFNFIITDATNPPDTAGSSEVQLNFDATAVLTGGTSTFRVRNAGAFQFLSTGGTTASEVMPIAGDVYNVWFVINNSADTYQIFMQSDDPATGLSGAPHQIIAIDGSGVNKGSTFGFRNGAAANDLITANFGNGTVAVGNAVNFDDIYVDLGGSNTINPLAVPEPGSIGLLGLVAGAGLLRRRKAARI